MNTFLRNQITNLLRDIVENEAEREQPQQEEEMENEAEREQPQQEEEVENEEEREQPQRPDDDGFEEEGDRLEKPVRQIFRECLLALLPHLVELLPHLIPPLIALLPHIIPPLVELVALLVAHESIVDSDTQDSEEEEEQYDLEVILKENYVDCIGKEEFSVCYESVKSPAVTCKTCKKEYHLPCLKQWLQNKKTCPTCRQ